MFPKCVCYLPKFDVYAYLQKYYLIFHFKKQKKMIINMYNIFIKFRYQIYEGNSKTLARCYTYNSS